jgi:hypothetical protein
VADVADNTCSFTPAAGGAYTVSVTPKNEAGSGTAAPKSVTVTNPPAPGAPTGVSGTPGDNSIDVSWTAPAAGGTVTDYTVVASADSYTSQSCPAPVTATSCTISNLAAGVAYTLHVVANGPGGSSTEATGTPSGPPTGTVQAPDAVPTGAISAGSATATPGAQVTISGDGYQPGSTVVITVYSTPVNLGTATVQTNGTFTATVTLPANLATGSHTLLASGIAPGGAVRYVSKALTVSAANFGPLPVTGVNAIRIGLGAVALLVLGVAAVVMTDGRIVRRFRRRPETTG